MDTLEEVPAIEDIESEIEERFEVFVTAYVSEFEKKLEEYAKKSRVGGIAKSGKNAETLVSPVGASAGAPILGGAGVSVGKGGSNYFSGKTHRNKAKKITQIFQTVKTEERRKMFVEAGSLIYFSFQKQFESVTDADGNWKRALRKLAIDARNRSISYLHNEASEPLSKDLLTKAVILGESKHSLIFHVTPKTVQQFVSGEALKSEIKEWKTSDIYEQVGIKIVESNGETKYYKKKMCSNDYGYRWSFNWEDDSSWMLTYEEDYSNVSEDIRTLLNLEELEVNKVQILTNINKEHTKLQHDEIEYGVDTMEEDLYEIKTKYSSELPSHDQPKIFTVKKPVKAFTGREHELAFLHEKLQAQQNHVVMSQSISICGLGGMGKSELVRKYAHTYHESYGSCIWIDSETQSSITQSFRRLAYNLQILQSQAGSAGTKSTEKDLRFILGQVYKCFSNTKTLFIFDNVNEYEDIKDYLPSNLPPTDEKPMIIITSRKRDWGIGDEGDAELILLDQFTPEEALSFVKKVLEIKNEDTSHDTVICELTKELCYFPLALRQAASYIKAEKCLNSTIENYLFELRYEKKKRDLMQMQHKTNRDRFTQTTYTTCQITFKNIEKNEANGPLALRLVEIFVYLPADNIPLRGFIKLAENKEKLKEAVDILFKYSIIGVREWEDEYDEERDEEIYFYVWHVANIHRLVQQVIRLWLQDGKREEDVLKAALTQIHDDIDPHHIATLWSFACSYTALIDNYFCKMYEETKSYGRFIFAFYEIVRDGDARTVRKLLNYFESRNDLWRVVSSYILNVGFVECSHNDLMESAHETHIKDLILFHAEVFSALKHSNTKDLELFLQSYGKSLINSLFDSRTALQRSARSGKLNVVKILVEHGADDNYSSGFDDNRDGADSNATYDYTVLEL